MPFYKYACQRCAHEFEELVLGGETPPCPACAQTELKRLPTSFAVGRAQPQPVAAPPGCGTCGDPRGPGACQR